MIIIIVVKCKMGKDGCQKTKKLQYFVVIPAHISGSYIFESSLNKVWRVIYCCLGAHYSLTVNQTLNYAAH